MTLLEVITGWMRSQCNKHDLHPDGPDAYVVQEVNQMSQCGLLEQISDALAEADIDLAPKTTGDGRMTWAYCPECGSKSLHHQEGEHKQCAVCHQEWFSDVDYSETVRGNLEKSKGDLYRMQTELDSVNAMVHMLESGEWAEHAGKGPIADRLETAITSLVNESAEKYALEDQVKGLQELMASGLPHDWRDRLMEEMSTRFELSKLSEDHLANDDTQIGVEFAIDWIALRLKT